MDEQQGLDYAETFDALDTVAWTYNSYVVYNALGQLETVTAANNVQTLYRYNGGLTPVWWTAQNASPEPRATQGVA